MTNPSGLYRLKKNFMGYKAGEVVAAYSEEERAFVANSENAEPVMAAGLENVNNSGQIKSLFGTEKKRKVRLGQGIVEDNFYYGTEVEQEGKAYSCLITSSKNKQAGFLVGWNENNQIETELGVKYSAEFDEDALNYVWRNKAIETYLTKKYESIDLVNLIEQQRKLWERFVYFPDAREYYLHSCAATQTYTFTLFDYQPRIDFRGQTEAGKSTASKLYKLTAFNSLWINKGSDAARFRDLESVCGTLIIDNFDSLPAEVKDDVCYFIEVSFDREGGTKRVMESVGKNKFRGRTFHAYCPMVVNSKLGYGVDSTQNRLVTTVMGKKKGVPKLDTKLAAWRDIREQCRLWALDNWPDVQNTYETLELPNFDSREVDIYKPILTIAKMAGGTVFENVSGLLQEKAELVRETAGEDSFEREVLGLLLEEFNNAKSIKIAVSDLAERLIGSHWEFDKEADRHGFMAKKKYAGTICKNILRNIPALSQSVRITHPQNRLTFEVFRDEVEAYMRVRGYLKGGNSDGKLNQY